MPILDVFLFALFRLTGELAAPLLPGSSFDNDFFEPRFGRFFCARSVIINAGSAGPCAPARRHRDRRRALSFSCRDLLAGCRAKSARRRSAIRRASVFFPLRTHRSAGSTAPSIIRRAHLLERGPSGFFDHDAGGPDLGAPCRLQSAASPLLGGYYTACLRPSPKGFVDCRVFACSCPRGASEPPPSARAIPPGPSNDVPHRPAPSRSALIEPGASLAQTISISGLWSVAGAASFSFFRFGAQQFPGSGVPRPRLDASDGARSGGRRNPAIAPRSRRAGQPMTNAR